VSSSRVTQKHPLLFKEVGDGGPAVGSQVSGVLVDVQGDVGTDDALVEILGVLPAQGECFGPVTFGSCEALANQRFRSRTPAERLSNCDGSEQDDEAGIHIIDSV
jgi:hypothetical protein